MKICAEAEVIVAAARRRFFGDSILVMMWWNECVVWMKVDWRWQKRCSRDVDVK